MKGRGNIKIHVITLQWKSCVLYVGELESIE